MTPSEPDETLFRVEAGAPDATELAALTAVLLARAAAREPRTPQAPAPAPARWRRSARAPRHDLPPSWRR